MTLPKIRLKKSTYKVYKTGLPFYDAARLIGVAHLFFGTASSEVEDKGAYWEVSGVDVERDEEQIKWTIKRIAQLPTKTRAGREQKPLEYKIHEFLHDKGHINKLSAYYISSYPRDSEFASVELRNSGLDGKKRALKVEYDAGFQSGTRGWDPLSKYEYLTTRTHGKDKILVKHDIEEVVTGTLGRGFAATVSSRTKGQTDTMYILPIFSNHFVLSGFLDFQRNYQHSAGGHVAAVLAAISILIDLTSKKIPVMDFTYTREVKGGQTPIFSESGYLGFEKICSLWWDAVKEENENILRLLRQIKTFLKETASSKDSQSQGLSRYLAHFVVTLDVNSLVTIEKLKARILYSGKAVNLFRGYNDVMEVKEIMGVK